MQEAKFLFETGVGRCDTGEWCWAARGRDMEEFFRDWERLPVSPSGDGWYLFGPYKTARAARLALREFEESADEFLRQKYQEQDAPDPRTLH